jgi:chemotaxis receptor (MCP) glutamine deamidase CheD
MSGHAENLHPLYHLLDPIGRTMYRLRGEARGARVPDAKRPDVLARTRGVEPRPETAPQSWLSDEIRQVAVEAGDVEAAATPTVLRTTLGSCIAVCLFDPVTRIGGMNHFMLPSGRSDERNPAAFGIHAMELLVNAMMKAGADRSRLEAKVFGGSSMLAIGAHGGQIAGRNTAFALEYLEAEEIPVTAQKVGGRQALVVQFRTDTGRARVRVVEDPSVVESERTAFERHAKDWSREEITFFGGAP